MIMFYPLEDIDYKRKKSEIIDINNQDISLVVRFKDYLKIYGVIFGIVFTISLLVFRDLHYLSIIALVMFLICIIGISWLYFFKFYHIRYDSIQECLIIKRWYGSKKIAKNKLKRVYVGLGTPSTNTGTNLYIVYLNENNKEKCILLDIFTFKVDDIKEFLNMFAI